MPKLTTIRPEGENSLVNEFFNFTVEFIFEGELTDDVTNGELTITTFEVEQAPSEDQLELLAFVLADALDPETFDSLVLYFDGELLDILVPEEDALGSEDEDGESTSGCTFPNCDC